METTDKPRPRNVRKLLARLNPKAQTFGGGFGGIPLETAIDIAGATGMAGGQAPPRLAIAVLCLRWWPGMFEGPRRTLGYRTIHHHPKVHAKLGDPDKKLLLPASCCERIPIEGPGENAAFRAIADLVETCIRRRIARDLELQDDNLTAEIRARLHGQPPPRRKRHGRPLPDAVAARVLATDFMDRWVRVVIDEYRNPNHCQTCQVLGRIGEVPVPRYEDGLLVEIKWETCGTCHGAGVTPWSSHRRARALRIGNHPFRDYLKPHHDGALALLRELEWRGARRLGRRLADEW